MTVSSDFQARLSGATLLTAEVLYYLPDHPSVLQSFSWQTMDMAPTFPRLAKFLDHWRREIEAIVHSVTICHQHEIAPRRFRTIDEVFRVH
jgi:uncharacterized protein Usg